MLYLRLSCYDLTSNSCLYSYLKHLPWYGVFESLTYGFACSVSTVSVTKKTVKCYSSTLPTSTKKVKSIKSTLLRMTFTCLTPINVATR